MMDSNPNELGNSIAVVGMSCRFPRANSVEQFWRLLRNGEEGIQFFSTDELVRDGMMASVVQRPNFVAAKGYLDRAEDFESELFGIHPLDAQVIDPQQRLLLECAWESLEDAGYDPRRFDGSIGVFAGVSMNSWLHQLYANQELMQTVNSYQLMISNDKDYAASRISYHLNLRGPSIAIQTACSTSLVAVAHACQSIACGECDMAIAGAASLCFPRKCGYLYEEGMILSPDGHCRPYDAKARGTVPGEGVGLVVLKRLEDALVDGDHIEAVIRGWAVNNDGSDKVGFTAPSVQGQANVVATALQLAGVPPNTIGYIEGHGTATPLGDPIEVAALCDVFRPHTSRHGSCWLGSVKSNLGHLDTAAGIAGFIKAVLALKHRQIPPTLHYESANREIDFANSPFAVADRLRSWKPEDGVCRAGVSSFGIGGTNCHVVLEEWRQSEEFPKRPSGNSQLLVFSAASDHAAGQLGEQLAVAAESAVDDLADIAYTLQNGRAELRHRRAIVCRASNEAAAGLRSHGGELLVAEAQGVTPPVTFLFPGQGAQFTGMARQLYNRFGVFRDVVDRCCAYLKEQCHCDVFPLLLAPSDDPRAATEIEQTSLAQPALVVVSLGLARLLEDWGIRPRSMVGHSIGEWVAACLAEVVTTEELLRIVAKRSWLMQQAPLGAMLAITHHDVSAVVAMLPREVEVAARNAPGAIAVSGPEAAIDALQSQLDSLDIRATRLRTSHAFHSYLMEPAMEEFQRFLSSMQLREPVIPFASTVTGTWITPAQATDADYWTTEMRQAVQFEDALRCVCEEGRQVLLEVGPGRTLQALARQIVGPGSDLVIISTMRSREGKRNDDEQLLEAIGKLWTVGGSVNWEAMHAQDKRQRVSLPTYPFQRRTYSAGKNRPAADTGGKSNAVQKQPLPNWFYGPSWRRSQLLPKTGTSRETPSQRWLIFCDRAGIAMQIGARLEGQGNRVQYVHAGDQFEELESNEFRIAPKLYGDFTQLIHRVAPTERPLDRVLHCWLLDEMAPDTEFDQIQPLGFQSLLFLGQALGQRPVANHVRIDAISSQIQDVSGDEISCAGKATMRGPLLVIPQEYPHISCQHLDVAPPRNDEDVAWLVEQAMNELDHEIPGCEAALRGRSRWVPYFEQLSLTEGVNAPADEPGAWMIVGGFGRIGLTMASWIMHTKQAPVVLVGRLEMPDASQWDEWLEDHDAGDLVSIRISAVRELMKSGAQVALAVADVADVQSLRNAAQQTVERFGSLRGIIHSAGVVENRIIHYTGPLDCQRQFRAKVDGIAALAKIADEFNVPRVLVNSSLSSQLGGIGFCAYTASNLYLDAFLQQANRRNASRWVGINWDGWLFPGMADLLEENPVLELTLSQEEGYRCLRLIDETPGLRQVVVSTGELEQRRKLWVQRQHQDEHSFESLNAGEDSRHPRPATLTATYAAPRDSIETEITAVWEELLGIEGIGINDNYIELGGHSLLAGQIVGRTRDRLKAPISIRSLFEFPTVAEIALHVKAIRLRMGDDDDLSGDKSERVEMEF